MATLFVDNTAQTSPVANDRRKGGPRDESGDVALSIAFDMALDVARSALESRARQFGSASDNAGQMFEADAKSPQQQREAALRADHEGEVQGKDGGRTDAASVQARRDGATASTKGGVRITPPGGDESVSSGRRVMAPGPDSDTKERAAAPVTEERSGALTISNSKHAKGGSEPIPHRDAAVAAPDRAGAWVSAAGSAVMTSERATSGVEQVAAKVGEVLGAVRSAGVETGRAAQGADVPQEHRQGKESAKPQTLTQRADEGRSTDQSETTKKADTKAFDELVRSLRVRSGLHRSTARMHLNPPELGRVLIDVRMEGELLELDVRTETAQASKLMHDRVAELRAALAEHGFVVDRFEVEQEGRDVVNDFAGGERSFDRSREQDHGRARVVRGGRQGATAAPVADGEPETVVSHAVAERRLDIKI